MIGSFCFLGLIGFGLGQISLPNVLLFRRQRVLSAGLDVNLLKFYHVADIGFRRLARVFRLEKRDRVTDLPDLPHPVDLQVCRSDLLGHVSRVLVGLPVDDLRIPPEETLGVVTHCEVEVLSHHFAMRFFALGPHFLHHSLSGYNALPGVCVTCEQFGFDTCGRFGKAEAARRKWNRFEIGFVGEADCLVVELALVDFAKLDELSRSRSRFVFDQELFLNPHTSVDFNFTFRFVPDQQSGFGSV